MISCGYSISYRANDHSLYDVTQTERVSAPVVYETPKVEPDEQAAQLLRVIALKDRQLLDLQRARDLQNSYRPPATREPYCSPFFRFDPPKWRFDWPWRQWRA